MHMKTIGIALALALLPMTAVAQSAGPQTAAPEARAKMREACAADVQKFCADIERAKGAMRACLEAHDSQVSSRCKADPLDRGIEAGAGSTRPGLSAFSVEELALQRVNAAKVAPLRN